MSPDQILVALAATQYGVFTRAQAFSVGFSRRMIEHRLKTGRWEQLHPGVYALAGSADSWCRRQIAACFWSSGAAAGKAAGLLHGLPDCDEAPIEIVTIRDRRVMPMCGIVAHVTTRLPRDQVVMKQSISTTSIERTLLDLCGQLRHPREAIVLDHALHKGLTTLGGLDYCLQLTARRGRNGCGILRNLLKERAGLSTFPNSPLETLIFEMIAESHLPMPNLQHEIYDEQGFIGRPDFVYVPEKIIIEGHSKLHHTGHYIEKKDLDKHHRFVALGYRPLYVTWADATIYRQATVARIDAMMEETDDLSAPERAGVWLS